MILYYFVLYFIALHCMVSHCVLYASVWMYCICYIYIVLYRIVLCCILYCSVCCLCIVWYSVGVMYWIILWYYIIVLYWIVRTAVFAMICIASSKHGIILQSEVASVGVLADLVKRIWSAVSVILVARSWVACSYGPTPIDFYVTIPYYSYGPIGFYVAILYYSYWPVGLFLWASM